MLKILLITIILVGIAFAGLAIRLILDRKAEFSGGSCQSGSKELDSSHKNGQQNMAEYVSYEIRKRRKA